MGWRPTLRAHPEPARASGHSGLLRRPREPLFRHAGVPACPHQQGLVRSWRTLAPARRVEEEHANDGVDAPRRHRGAKVVVLTATLREASVTEVSTIGLDL